MFDAREMSACKPIKRAFIPVLFLGQFLISLSESAHFNMSVAKCPGIRCTKRTYEQSIATCKGQSSNWHLLLVLTGAGMHKL